MDFVGKGKPLLQADLEAALSVLGLDPVADLPVLWAVLAVESRGFGFLPDRRPKILFERHIFFRESGGKFAAISPDLCSRTGGGYIGGGAEFARLARAIQLCRNAGLDDELALRSASWGLGQVMGFNAVASGFKSASDMAVRMCQSEAAQLGGMAGFMRAEGLHTKLQSRDWVGFAKRYNGSSYWKNQYDVKLGAAFEKFASGVSRDLRARAAQGALVFLGYKPGDPDGVVGQNTRRAIVAFRSDHDMGKSDLLDDALFDALMERAGLK